MSVNVDISGAEPVSRLKQPRGIISAISRFDPLPVKRSKRGKHGKLLTHLDIKRLSRDERVDKRLRELEWALIAEGRRRKMRVAELLAQDFYEDKLMRIAMMQYLFPKLKNVEVSTSKESPFRLVIEPVGQDSMNTVVAEISEDDAETSEI